MPRLIFANQLRGLAALCVVLTHLVGVFWMERDLVSLATASPAQVGSPPAALLGLFTHRYLNFGPLGISVFFLISGLVIPISLAQHSRISFTLARLLRIYPTYVAALLFQVGVVFAVARYWGNPFPHSISGFLANALLIQDFVGVPRIDPISWTLNVELKFYLLMMLLAPLIRRGSVATLFALAGVLLASNVLAPWTHLSGIAGVESMFLVFMLNGVLFNYRWRGLIGRAAFLVASAAMLTIFLACWWFSILRWQFWLIPVNYFYGIAIFGTAYVFRNRFRPILLLDLLADISFPLYVIHFLGGLSLLKLLTLRFGLDYPVALAITLPALLALATLMHVTIESRTIAMGRALARSAWAGPRVLSFLPPFHPIAGGLNLTAPGQTALALRPGDARVKPGPDD